MYCLSCGAENNDSANFCQNCGASSDLFRVMPSSRDETTRVSQAFKQPSFSSPPGNQNIVLIIGGIIVVIAVGVAGYFYAKSETSSIVANQTVSSITPPKKQEPTPSSTVVSIQIDNSANIKKQQQENQEALDKQRKEDEAKKFADQATIEVENLLPQMRDEAESVTKQKYPNYNFRECIPGVPKINNPTDGKITFTRLFDCQVVGKYVGIKHHEIRIKVPVEILKQGNSMSSKILDYEVLYSN